MIKIAEIQFNAEMILSDGKFVLVEMAEISKKLKEVLNHPPLGLNDVPLVISKGGRDAKRTATRANANN